MKRHVGISFLWLGRVVLFWVAWICGMQELRAVEGEKKPSASPFVGQEAQLAAFLREYPRAYAMTPKESGKWARQARFNKAAKPLVERFNLVAPTLFLDIEKYAKLAFEKKALPPMDMARLFFIAEKHRQVMDMALQAGDAAHRATPRRAADVVAALELAAYSAMETQLYDQARKYLNVAASEISPEFDLTAWTRLQTALAYTAFCRSDYPEQQKILRGVYEKHRLALGASHVETLRYHNELAAALYDQRQDAAAEVEYREILKRLEESDKPDDAALLAVRKNLATVLESLKRPAEAEPFRRLVVEHYQMNVGDGQRDTNLSILRLAKCLQDQYKLDEAESYLRDLLAINLQVDGPDHDITLSCREYLASVIFQAGRFEEAATQQQLVYEKRKRLLGPNHEQTLEMAQELGISLHSAKQEAKAEPLFRQVLAMRVKMLHPDHLHLIQARGNLAATCQALGKLQEAEELARDACISAERALAPDHITYIKVHNLLTMLFDRPEAQERQLTQYREAWAVLGKRLGPDHPDTLANLFNMAIALSKLKRFEEAEKTYRAVLAGRQRSLGALHPITLATQSTIGGLLMDTNRLPEAEVIFKQVIGMQQAVVDADDRELLLNHFRLGIALARQAKLTDSMEHLKHVQTTLPQKNDFTLFRTEVDNLIGQVAQLLQKKEFTGQSYVGTGGILAPSVMSGIPQGPSTLPLDTKLTTPQTITLPVQINPSPAALTTQP